MYRWRVAYLQRHSMTPEGLLYFLQADTLLCVPKTLLTAWKHNLLPLLLSQTIHELYNKYYREMKMGKIYINFNITVSKKPPTDGSFFSFILFFIQTNSWEYHTTPPFLRLPAAGSTGSWHHAQLLKCILVTMLSCPCGTVYCLD